MKTRILTLTLLFCSLAVTAQKQRPAVGHKPGGGDLHQFIKDSLNLTEAQKAELKELKVANRARIQEIKKLKETDPAAAKTAAKLLREEMKAKVESILDATQNAKLAAHVQVRKSQSSEKRAEKMTARMKDSLALSADQLEKVGKLNLEFCQRLAGLKEKADAGASKEELEPLRKSVTKEYREGLKAVLSEAQLAKLKSSKQNHKGKKH